MHVLRQIDSCPLCVHILEFNAMFVRATSTRRRKTHFSIRFGSDASARTEIAAQCAGANGRPSVFLSVLTHFRPKFETGLRRRGHARTGASVRPCPPLAYS